MTEIVMEAGFAGTARFEVVRHLGSGGMGAVYEALDRTRGARVALKTVRVTSPESLLLLKNEFRSLQDVRHPNLVDLVELVEHEGHVFFTMELVEGTDLLGYVRPGATAFGVSGNAETASLKDGSWGDMAAARRATTPGGTLDEGRLRGVLAQLARALCALHDTGRVHRDLKPSNVLVASSGRVVVVDFGLATTARTDGPLDAKDQARAVGTRAFMAPEQAAGSRVTGAADWYSVGVVLYLALTGELPFHGAELARKKAHGAVDPVRARNPAAPEDLASLADALLALDPAARPTGHEVLGRLGLARETTGTSTFDRESATTPFVGRRQELLALHAAFEASREHAVTVLVDGDSGVGKTALVRELTREVERSGRGALAFWGRCYERELVPYKAFDGIVDALSQHLRGLDRDAAAPLIPDGAAILARVFPVLRRVAALATPAQAPADDPQTQRARAFGALRALLGRLARERPLVLCIDDLQWADSDSFQLLEDLLQPPDAPRILLLATTRPRSAAATDRIEAAAARIGEVRRVKLAPLSFDDARHLAAESLGAEDARQADAIAREAGGHPLFVLSLALHAARAGQGEGDARGPLKLDDAIWSRVDGLPGAARSLLEVVALVGAPVSAEVAIAASELDPAGYPASTGLLVVAHLIRASGPGTIESYHDRVRETVLAHLDPDRRRRCHSRIAAAFENTTSAERDPQDLVRHLEGAGEYERAALQAERAAARAADALAFDQAAAFYRTALRLGDYAGRSHERQAVRVALADALTNAGRGAEAAEAYLACVDGAEPAERVEHRRRAADHLLRSGHLQRGTTILAEVLREIGEALPSTQLGALASMLVRRARTSVRGLRWAERPGWAVADDRLMRLDVYHAVSVSLALIDTVRGGVYQARSIALALETGEPLRLGRSLTMEACYLGSTNSRGLARGRAVWAEVSRIADKTGDAYLSACATLVDAFLDYHGGAFGSAEAKFRLAEARFRRETRGTYFESGFCHWFRLVALRNRGMFGELSRGFFEWTRDAERRGDRFSEASLRLNLNAVWLARDDPHEALHDLDRAGWIPPEGGYHLQHWYEQYARSEIDIYTGDFAGGAARFRPVLTSLSRSFILRMRVHRVLAWWTLGRLVVSAGGRAGLDEAEGLARKLAREDVAYARVFGLLLAAAVARRRGKRSTEDRALGDAIRLSESHDLPHSAAAARWRLGEIATGGRGDDLIGQAREWMQGQDIRAPERMVALWAP
jgi:hypothetical protein